MQPKKLNYALFILLGFVLTSLGFSCHKGYGCPNEGIHVNVDKNGNPKKKSTSGLYDKKGRMNGKGNKNDRRKPKKHTN